MRRQELQTPGLTEARIAARIGKYFAAGVTSALRRTWDSTTSGEAEANLAIAFTEYRRLGSCMEDLAVLLPRAELRGQQRQALMRDLLTRFANLRPGEECPSAVRVHRSPGDAHNG